MNEINFTQSVLVDSSSRRYQQTRDRHAVLWREASQLFWHAYSGGQLLRLLAHLGRRIPRLYDLNRLGHTGCQQHYAGLQTVPVSRIHGSEGRCRDFNGRFHPTDVRLRERWMRVALAVLQGAPLPAVQLIQIGDIYFVRDGHHRISVAIAWGQDFVDAEVTVWEMPHPLPWQQPAPTRSSLTGLRRALAL